ncbi:MAG: hypothetical protein NC393_07275 [Clostridium sp.]|nr:hypothetical protein [Clostridium sp.]MCM1171913.1 hypothetical protein [Clostridium sp.]MCM1209352.1 hypothetical protein [Ruminococcus sp.]
MSQAKVDKYKKEKKNRAKTIKKKKIKAAAGFIVLCLIIGAAIGFPLGKKIYKDYAAERAANATIEADLFHYNLQKYWSENYTELFPHSHDDTASDTDASDDEASDNTASDAATENASGTDAQ